MSQSHRVLEWYFGNWDDEPFGGGWIRLFGYGLLLTNSPPPFSVREGARRPTVQIGAWRLHTLNP